MYTLPWLPFVVFDDDEMMSDDDDDDARTVMRIMIYSGGDECWNGAKEFWDAALRIGFIRVFWLRHDLTTSRRIEE